MMKHIMSALLIGAVSAGAAWAKPSAGVPRAQALSEFGKCIVGQAPAKSRALMAAGVDTPVEYKIAGQLVHANNGCIKNSASLTMKTGQIRGAIAETLLVADADRMKQLASAPATAAVRPGFADGRAFVYNYAKCLAVADRPKSAALIQTAHGSPAEREAFLAFGETTSACMPFTAKYTVNIPDVRNHIAVALYELAAQGETKVATGG